MYTTAKLKKYIALYFINFLNNVGFGDYVNYFTHIDHIDKFDTADQFEGYISANLCLLYLVNTVLLETKTHDDVDLDDDALPFILLIDSFNKKQKLNTKDDTPIKGSDFSKFDQFYDIDCATVPEEMLRKLNEYCPKNQNRNFYNAWTIFSTVLFAAVNDEPAHSKMYSIKNIVAALLVELDICIEAYLKKFHMKQYLFWWVLCKSFITCEFNLAGKEYAETQLAAIMTKAWKEHVIKEINYNSKHASLIKKILLQVKGEGLAAELATDYIFALQEDE
jgi:hypothetical protein